MASFYQKGVSLHSACSSGNLARCQEVIETGVDVNLILNGVSALHIAAQNSNPELCKLLINNGANVEASDKFKKTAAFYASKFGNAGALKELCEGGASMEIEIEETTPIHEAASRGHSLCIEAICAHDPELIHLYTEDGHTPLHRASMEGHTAAVRCCLRLGADPNGGVDAEYPGSTPAHLAASSGHEGVIRALGAVGADFYLFDESKQDVFDVAEAHGHSWLFDIMKQLEKDQESSADGGDSVSINSSYLPGGPGGLEVKFLGDERVKMPESFKEYKWPWQRKHGF